MERAIYTLGTLFTVIILACYSIKKVAQEGPCSGGGSPKGLSGEGGSPKWPI